jgi:hypothetical protein
MTTIEPVMPYHLKESPDGETAGTLSIFGGRMVHAHPL